MDSNSILDLESTMLFDYLEHPSKIKFFNFMQESEGAVNEHRIES